MIDSGADKNILTSADFVFLKSMRARIFKSNSNMRVKAYGGQPLQVQASFKAEVKGTDPEKPAELAEFLVVEGTDISLLACHTAEQIRLLKIGNEVRKVSVAKQFPCVPGIRISIDVDKSVKPRQEFRLRIPLALQQQVIKEMDRLEAEGIITPCPVKPAPSFVSALQVVPKGKENVRLVVDLRNLNKAVRRSPHHLPTLQEMIANIRDSAWFSKVDLTSAYHHLMLEEESQLLTAFNTQKGLFMFTRLPFGLKTAPEAFQSFMDKEFKSEGVIVYQDDILIHSKTFEQNQALVNNVMEKLKILNLSVNEGKSELFKEKIVFLGHVISMNRIEPEHDKLQAIKEMEIPKTTDELSSFLGLVRYLSPFISHLAGRIINLDEAIKRNKRVKAKAFQLNEEEIKEFETLRNELISTTMSRGIFNTRLETKLYADACRKAIGAFLLQKQADGSWVVVEWLSRKLTSAERNYPQTHREALAIVYAVTKWHFYLFGKRFVIVTDCEALQFIFNNALKDETSASRLQTRSASFALKLQCYDFEVEFIKGKNNPADALSRLVSIDGEEWDEYEDMAALAVIPNESSLIRQLRHDSREFFTLAEISKASESCQLLQEVLKAIQSGVWKTELLSYRCVSQELALTQEGVLIRQLPNRKVVVPPLSLRVKILDYAHGAGHVGSTAMRLYIRGRAWWGGLDTDVCNYVNNCVACTQMRKSSNEQPMKILNTHAQPLSCVAVDFYQAEDISLFVLIDTYSRYAAVYKMGKKDFAAVQKKMLDFMRIFGVPHEVNADNGPPFNSFEWSRFLKEFAIMERHSTPLWPQGNSLVERLMPRLTKCLMAAKIRHESWEELLLNFVAHYNCLVNSNTQRVPFEVMFGGRQARGPVPVIEYNGDGDIDNVDSDRLNRFKKIVQEDAKRKASETDIKTGDEVYMRNGLNKAKLVPTFSGTPFKVIEKKKTELTLEAPNGEIFKRHVAHVKKVPEKFELYNNCFGSEEVVETTEEDTSTKEAEEVQDLMKPARRPVTVALPVAPRCSERLINKRRECLVCVVQLGKEQDHCREHEIFAENLFD
jgi:RNase H-like domain found in reverse transcriptase/Reverse transcriptase (RNA-dependent DNA polymerase)/Integrase zinc binding domain